MKSLRFPPLHPWPKRQTTPVFYRRLRTCLAKWQPYPVATSDTVVAPETKARIMAFLPRGTALQFAVTAGTTGDSETRRVSVHHRALSSSRETAATGVDSGRRLFHNLLPPVHHRSGQQPEILGRHRLRSLRGPPKARPRAQGAHQLRSLRSLRYTHTDVRMAHPHAQPRPATRFHLAIRGGRRPTSNHRGGPASQLQPLGRLPQQQDPRRGHFPVNTSPDSIHTVPERKDNWEQHTGGRSLCRVPGSHMPLGMPAGCAPQHDTPHQNDTRPTSILSTPPPRAGPTRDSQSRIR